MSRPVRINDIVQLTNPNLGYQVGAKFRVVTLDLLNNVVSLRSVKRNNHKYAKIKDIEILRLSQVQNGSWIYSEVSTGIQYQVY